MYINRLGHYNAVNDQTPFLPIRTPFCHFAEIYFKALRGIPLIERSCFTETIHGVFDVPSGLLAGSLYILSAILAGVFWGSRKKMPKSWLLVCPLLNGRIFLYGLLGFFRYFLALWML